MTDKTIPADKVKKLAARFRQQIEPHIPFAESVVWERAAEAVEALLPAPTPPTLADMTHVARRACQWMQCEVRGERRIIILVLDDSDENYVVTLDSSGYISHCPLEWVTPLPDLPRMSWPGTEKPDPGPALPDGWRVADHKDNGRVIVTNTTPDRDGRVYYVLHSTDPLGFDWLLCKPYELTYLDQ